MENAKRPEREANNIHLVPKLKNAWSYTSIVPYMSAWRGT